MNKDIEWLKEEVRKLRTVTISPFISGSVNINSVLRLIDQLDEPEITEEQAWDLISDKYFSKDSDELYKAYLEQNGYTVVKKEKLYYLRLRDKDLPLYKAYDMKRWKYKLVYSAHHLRNENFLTVTFSESEIENMDIRSFELEEVTE